MKCKEVIKKSNYYFDNILSKEERLEIEMHLNECNKCKEYYNEEKVFFEILDSEPLINPPDDFTERILKESLIVKPTNKEAFLIPVLARSMVMAGVSIMVLNFASVNVYSNLCSIFKLTSDINNIFIRYSQNLGDYLSILNGGII